MKGRVTKQFVVWCGTCARWEQGGNVEKAAIDRWTHAGWNLTKRYGWRCPNCVMLSKSLGGKKKAPRKKRKKILNTMTVAEWRAHKHRMGYVF